MYRNFGEHGWRILSAALLAVAIPVAAEAQTGQVTGTITDQNTGGPLGTVQVFLEGTSAGALSSSSGAFSLTDVPPGTYSLVAQRIGYQQAREEGVTVTAGGTTNVNISMAQAVLALQGVVATGLVDPVEGVRAPISVGRVDRDMMPVMVASGDAVESLQGRVAGVRMNRGSGQPGEGVSIMLRSPTTLRGGGSPLIVVDGVVLSGTGVASTVDIEGMDIESVEVIKGAAASSLYGSRAAAGVIAITTRDGSGMAVGDTRFTARTEYGVSQNVRGVNLNNHHAFLMDPTNSFYVDENGNQVSRANRVLPSTQIAVMDKPYPDPLYDNINAITHPGTFLSNNFSIAGNTESTNFMVSLNNLSESGILVGNNGYDRNGFRVNVDHRFMESLSMGVTMYHSRDARDDQSDTGGGGNPFIEALRAPRDVDFSVTDAQGNFLQQPDPNIPFQNPLWTEATRDFSRKGARTLAGVNMSWSPLSWFSASGSAGYDRSEREVREYIPKGTPRNVGQSGTQDGRIEFNNDRLEAWNAEAQATLRRDFGPLNVRTTVRGLMERNLEEARDVQGSNFVLAGVPTIGNIPSNERSGSSSEEEVRATGYLWDTAFDYDGKYIFTVLGRRDGSSLFGPDNRWHNYYRVAGAWRIAEEPWFNVPNLNELKLTAARGTAGGRPSFAWQYETWSLSGGIPTKGTLGNRDLAPEHTTENEFSLSAIVYDRFSVVLTHARQTTEDQLTPMPLPALTGYSTQWVNTGTIEGHSTELEFEAQVIQRPDFSWNSMVVADYSFARITEWDAPCYAQGWRWNCANIPVYGIYSRWLLKDREGLNQHDNGSAVPVADQFQVNDEGFLVWVGEGNNYWEGWDKNLWGTSTEIGGLTYQWGHPFYERTEVGLPHRTMLGTSNPTSFGWINNVRLGQLSLHAAMHAAIGGDANNRSHQFMYDTDIATAPRMDQAGKPEGLKKPIQYFRSAMGGDATYTIEDASYLKLRTLSANYLLNQNQIQGWGLGATGLESVSLGLVVRNVFTLSNYDGFDPENALNLNNRSNADGGGYPPTRNLTAEVTVTF
ncbi:MAG: SusC/RagA family TonB-linked outer membrane protein [Gemmatimonadota bacterium]